MTRRIILALIVVLMAVGFIAAAPAHPADAATSTTTFPVSYEARPGTVQAGDVILIGSYSLVSEPNPDPNPIIGLTCTFRVTSTNDESVHVNNYAEIRTNGSSTLVTGTEDGVNGVHVVDSTLVLGESIEVWYYVGQRAPGETPVGISVELEVSFTCTTTDDTTTTTVTVPSSSTTSTLPPGGSTSTSVSTPPTSAPTTTVPTGSTTTTLPIRPPHTDPPVPPTTVPPVTSPPTLPFTDEPGDWDREKGLAMAGAALILLGAALVMGLKGATE